MKNADLQVILSDNPKVNDFLNMSESNENNIYTPESKKLEGKDKKIVNTSGFLSSIVLNIIVLNLTNNSFIVMFVSCMIYLFCFHFIANNTYSLLKEKKIKEQKELYPNANYIIGDPDKFKDRAVLFEIESYYNKLDSKERMFIKRVITTSKIKNQDIEQSIKDILITELSDKYNYSYIYDKEDLITNFITKKYHYDTEIIKLALKKIKDSLSIYKKEKDEIEKELKKIESIKEEPKELINNVIQNL